MDWNQRLTQARTAKNINKSEMAKLIGVSAATVTQWENSTIRHIAGKHLTRVCELLDVTPEWLLYGTDATKESSARVPAPGAMKIEYLNDDDPSFVPIRMVKLRLSAGISGYSIEPEHDSDSLLKMSQRWIQKNGFQIENLIGIKVRGESMEPSLYDGDVVVINTADTAPVDGAVFAVNYEGEDVVKRLVRDAGSWWLASDNPDHRRYPKKSCRGNDCMLVGRVVWREGGRV